MTQHDFKPTLDAFTKGAPSHRLSGNEPVAQRGWNVLREDMPLPLAVIKRSVLEANSRWMQAFMRKLGVQFCPHGKTTMSPQLFARQLADGAWGITCATPQQLNVVLAAGARRALVANQIVGRANIDMLLAAVQGHPAADIHLLADSIEAVRALASRARELQVTRPIFVLAELAARGSRTGCRNIASLVEVATEVARHHPHLILAGVEGYEGTIATSDPAAAAHAVTDFAEQLLDAAGELDRRGLFQHVESIILSAGGSEYFDIIALTLRKARLSQPAEVVLRSGCYLTHDTLHYSAAFERIRSRTGEAREGAGLKPALEVWAYVQSRPEPTRAYANMGKRDVSSDWDLPVAVRWFRPGRDSVPQAVPENVKITALNDQHAHLECPADSPLAIGDMLAFGISHPCTTFDKWRTLYLVDDDYTVVDVVQTCF
ncbi:MAG: hypothetical protein EPN36_01645 [Rhodanobacteraceae bacterium]|nr:MAG: hypothetical protein EPN36_01645 [Rhodanobacteraceae bacterium]